MHRTATRRSFSPCSGALPTLLLVAVGCGGDERDGGPGPSPTATVQLNVVTSAPSVAASSRVRAAAVNSVETFGDLPLQDLRQFSMYFRSIQLCNSLVENGSGYSNTFGCVTLFENYADEYTGTLDPTPDDRARFQAAGEGRFFDMASADGRAALGRAASIDPGEYNYGIIEAHPWVKMTAQVGTDLCTRNGGGHEVGDTGQDGLVNYHTEVSTLSCDGVVAAEEALVYIRNANNYFRFQQPFVVEVGDEVELDLALNLDKIVKFGFGGNNAPRALTSAGCDDADAATRCEGFSVPLIDMVPAPRKTGETTKVETYVMVPDPSVSDEWAFRLQLYFNSADETKAVQAVLADPLSTPATLTLSGTPVMYVSKYSQTGDAAIVASSDGEPVVEFTRNGQAGTATFHCGRYSFAEGCPNGGTVQVTFDAPVTTDLQ